MCIRDSYYQMTSTFAKPVNVSLTMANDSLLRDFLSEEAGHLDDGDYTETLQGFLSGYRDKYGYDSVFLVSTATGRYYNFNGLDLSLIHIWSAAIILIGKNSSPF